MVNIASWTCETVCFARAQQVRQDEVLQRKFPTRGLSVKEVNARKEVPQHVASLRGGVVEQSGKRGDQHGRSNTHGSLRSCTCCMAKVSSTDRRSLEAQKVDF